MLYVLSGKSSKALRHCDFYLTSFWIDLFSYPLSKTLESTTVPVKRLWRNHVVNIFKYVSRFFCACSKRIDDLFPGKRIDPGADRRGYGEDRTAHQADTLECIRKLTLSDLRDDLTEQAPRE